jgi:thioredoxin-related protein
MKTPLALVCTVVLAALTTVASAAEGWMTDYAKALEKAKTEKKMVLLDFTGSDWCPPCMQLEKDIFSKDEFKKYAEKNLVLVELDFPNTKELPADLKAQNDKLAKEYAIRGYPTLVVLSPEGKKLTEKVGYLPGGPEALIGMIDQAKK